MLRLQWELVAGEVEPLVDLVVMSVFPVYLALQRGRKLERERTQNSPKSLQSNIAQDAGWILYDMLREELKKIVPFTITALNHYKNTPTSSAQLQHMFLSQRHLHQMQSRDVWQLKRGAGVYLALSNVHLSACKYLLGQSCSVLTSHM